LFAGVEGAILRKDLDDNAALYGKKLETRDIVTQGVRTPFSFPPPSRISYWWTWLSGTSRDVGTLSS